MHYLCGIHLLPAISMAATLVTPIPTTLVTNPIKTRHKSSLIVAHKTRIAQHFSTSKFLLQCHSTNTRSILSATSTSLPQTQSNANELVESLLTTVANTDRGVMLNAQEQDKVVSIFSDLERYCIDEPLKSPLIFGEWDVEYTSNPTSTGGYFRSALGRLLLNTKNMIQSVETPNTVKNKVSFRALNQIDGEVSIQGSFTPLTDKCIEITFEPPRLALGPFNFQFGGDSSVKISITYLDEKVRLGRGSRGSLFIFKKRSV